MQVVHTRNGENSGITFFLQTSWSEIDLKVQTLNPKSVWNKSLTMATPKVITKPTEQYATRTTQNSWSNNLRLGRPWRTRPRCAKRMRTVRNKKVKRAVLLKRTMSAGKRRLCKSPKKSQSQFSWDERARVVKLKAVQRISKKVTDFAYIKYFFEILRFVWGGGFRYSADDKDK